MKRIILAMAILGFVFTAQAQLPQVTLLDRTGNMGWRLLGNAIPTASCKVQTSSYLFTTPPMVSVTQYPASTSWVVPPGPACTQFPKVLIVHLPSMEFYYVDFCGLTGVPTSVVTFSGGATFTLTVTGSVSAGTALVEIAP